MKRRRDIGPAAGCQIEIAGIKPTPEVLSWVRSRSIAFAKAKQRDAA